MMTRISCLLLAAALPAAAQSVTSDPIGFNKVLCLANSDTIVGVPLRKEGSQQALLTASPVIDGDSATLTLSASNLGTLAKHYLKFNSGAKDGSWFDITANTAGSVTINLNGESLGGATTGDSVTIAEYWTLDTLFPPAGATTGWTETPAGSGNWVPNGHAIVASSSASLTQRKTEVILPDLAGTGTNRLPTDLFYITGGLWRKPGIAESQGDLVIFPDSFFTIRHRPSVSHSTTFRAVGEVEVDDFTIPLATLTTGKHDTYLAIPRPVDVRLDQLNLVESGAFVTSPSASLTQRRDELLVFDNEASLLNKIPSVAYYHTGGNWRRSGVSTPQNDQVIPAGAGFVIRKYQTADGATVMWKNIPFYSQSQNP